MDLKDIGEKIKALRLENGLTQAELASRTELSKGFISQVESGSTVPSLETLHDILEILGVSFTEFFAADDEEPVVFSEEDFYISEDEELHHQIAWIVPNAQKYEMEPIIITLPPGGKSMLDKPHAGEEFGLVLEGEVSLKYGPKRFTIKKGQSFYYRCNKQHGIENNQTRTAKILWESTPPMF